MKKNKFLLFAWIFVIGCIMAGGFLGLYIIGRATGEYNYDLILPIVEGTVSGFIIFLIIYFVSKKRRGKVPEFDERSLKIMQRYLMIVLYVVLFGSGAALIILYLIGVHQIETGMLIVCLMGLYFIIGIGALVTKRL